MARIQATNVTHVARFWKKLAPTTESHPLSFTQGPTTVTFRGISPGRWLCTLITWKGCIAGGDFSAFCWQAPATRPKEKETRFRNEPNRNQKVLRQKNIKRQPLVFYDEVGTMLDGNKRCSILQWSSVTKKTEHQNPPSEALPLLTVVFRLAKPEVKTASNEPNQVPIKSVTWWTWNFS